MKHKQCSLFQKYLNSIQLCIILLLLYLKNIIIFILCLKTKKKTNNENCLFLKRAWDPQKKNKLFSKTKLKPMYQTKFFLVGSMNSVLQTWKQFYKNVYQTSPNLFNRNISFSYSFFIQETIYIILFYFFRNQTENNIDQNIYWLHRNDLFYYQKKKKKSC